MRLLLFARPYNLVVYYGGHFMTSVAYQYSGPKSKVFKRIDVDKLSVKDIREMVRDVVSDDDKLYMMRDGVTPDEGFKLLVKDKHVLELVNASEMTGVCKIHVYHAYSQAPLPPVLEDSEDEEEAVKESEADNMIGDVGNNEKNQDDEEISIIEVPKKCTARKRVSKGKEILIEQADEEDEERISGEEKADEGNEDGENTDEDYENEDSGHDSEDSDEDNDWSDEEFGNMRKIRDEVRREQKTIDEEQTQFIKDTVEGHRNADEGNKDGGNIGGGNVVVDTSESEYEPGSEMESDDELFAYTEPNLSVKKKRVNQPFNTSTAGKDIKCAKGCPFRMWLSYMLEFEGWQIKTVLDDHNCIYQYSNKLVTVKYLADLYGSRIRRNPNWKLTEMQDEFKRVLKVEICGAKCCRVRKMALSGVQEEMKHHYAQLRRFGGEILRSNRENTVKICTTRQNEGDAPNFQRFYVCYAELKKAWKVGCRPVLGLDGCFLKTVCGGQLLSAVGRDGNNSIFPVAMAVVESESYDSWRWFLMLLQEDLDLGNGFAHTLISDQQKVLIAILNLFFYFVYNLIDLCVVLGLFTGIGQSCERIASSCRA